jgi:hypothetical protein
MRALWVEVPAADTRLGQLRVGRVGLSRCVIAPDEALGQPIRWRSDPGATRGTDT